MRYKMFTDSRDEWRWHLLAANNRKIAASGEGYANKQDCRDAIDLVKKSGSAPVDEE